MIRKAIPHVFTLANLFCGLLGIVLAFQAELFWSSILIGVAAVMDFFDGLAARVLGVPSELGKQLDSLADVVTFGALPGIVLFNLLSASYGEYFEPIVERPFAHVAISCIGLLVGLFAALRLAIFNIDEKQRDGFLGVPVPAVAILIGSIPVILHLQYGLNLYFPLTDDTLPGVMKLHYWGRFDFYLVLLLQNRAFLVALSIVMSLLMVSRIPMLSFKFKNLRWEPNADRFIFLILVGVGLLLVFLPYWFRISFLPYLDYAILPIILVAYVLYSSILALIRWRKTVRTEKKNS